MMRSWHGNSFHITGPCITNVIATCRKNFSQWESSFLWKLRCHWLKFLRRVAKTLVIQGPGLFMGIQGHWWISWPKGQWCRALIFFYQPEKAVEQTVTFLLIWDTMMLMWCHCEFLPKNYNDLSLWITSINYKILIKSVCDYLCVALLYLHSQFSLDLFRIVSLTLVQSYDFPYATEVTMKHANCVEFLVVLHTYMQIPNQI